MNHYQRLIEAGHTASPDCKISLPVAKDHGYYPGLLYAYLVEKQAEQQNLGDVYNKRLGIKWIPKLTYADILGDVLAFPDVRTIKEAAKELLAEGLIRTETTGAFLESDHRTGAEGGVGRRQDVATWWHVSSQSVPGKAVPAEYFSQRLWYKISALEAAQYGMAQALILAHWRRSDPVLDEDAMIYKRLSAVELTKLLPFANESTARRNLDGMMKSGLLAKHPVKPKLYRLTVDAFKAKPLPLHLRLQAIVRAQPAYASEEDTERAWVPAFKRPGFIGAGPDLTEAA